MVCPLTKPLLVKSVAGLKLVPKPYWVFLVTGVMLRLALVILPVKLVGWVRL